MFLSVSTVYTSLACAIFDKSAAVLQARGTQRHAPTTCGTWAICRPATLSRLGVTQSSLECNWLNPGRRLKRVALDDCNASTSERLEPENCGRSRIQQINQMTHSYINHHSHTNPATAIFARGSGVGRAFLCSRLRGHVRDTNST